MVLLTKFRLQSGHRKVEDNLTFIKIKYKRSQSVLYRGRPYCVLYIHVGHSAEAEGAVLALAYLLVAL
jgi:hypothetical protein